MDGTADRYVYHVLICLLGLSRSSAVVRRPSDVCSVGILSSLSPNVLATVSMPLTMADSIVGLAESSC